MNIYTYTLRTSVDEDGEELDKMKVIETGHLPDKDIVTILELLDEHVDAMGCTVKPVEVHKGWCFQCETLQLVVQEIPIDELNISRRKKELKRMQRSDVGRFLGWLFSWVKR